MQQDQQFLEYVIKALVDNPDQVKVTRTVDEMGVLLTLECGAADMGKIIGRQGNTAKAVRTLLRVVGMKHNSRVNLKINEPVGGLKDPSRVESAMPTVPLSTPNSKTVDEAMADLKLD
ncbi:MAG: KH domain-containing protein [Candidatus Taylorbacteria bacterium]